MNPQEKSKEGTDDFQPEWDTDTFEGGDLEGIERDKRGELAILLPDGSRTIARLRGLTQQRSKKTVKEGETAGASELVENGTVFSGVLRDEEGTISIEDALPRDEAEIKTGEKPEITKVTGPGEQPAPDDGKKAGIMDFDLDFGPPTEKIAKDDMQETMPIRPHRPEPTGTRPGPTSMPHDETIPIETPDAPTSVLDSKRDNLTDSQKHPEASSAPIILQGPKPKNATLDDKPTAAPPPIKAHSYLEDERVVDSAEVKVQRTPSKKRMKLPKRVKEKKTSVLLFILMILLLLVLAAILAVQHVPEARDVYHNLLAEILGTQQSDKSDVKPPSVEFVVVEVGSQKVTLKKGTDSKAAVSYASALRKLYAAGRDTKPGRER